MAPALPLTFFRTYLDVDTSNFMTHHFAEAPVTTFCPPVGWNLAPWIFQGMITLDTTRFYDTEIPDRPRSYVIVPSELETDNQRLLGLSMFEYRTDVLYSCHPVRYTIPAQVRALHVSNSDACAILMPSPNCASQVPLTTLFHEVVVVMRYQKHLITQDH